MVNTRVLSASYRGGERDTAEECLQRRKPTPAMTAKDHRSLPTTPDLAGLSMFFTFDGVGPMLRPTARGFSMLSG